jgi:penicillin-insensitive murein DD-endopeptidase
LGLLAMLGLAGCITRTPTPLDPSIEGSIGTTSKGILRNGAEVQKSETLRWLRGNDRHWGLPRFTRAIERAAAKVAAARPGSVLYVGDLSTRDGGALMPHFSHRNGRDADLLLYLTTLDGAPVHSPGFISFDTDGIAWDAVHRRYLRLDVERQWLLMKALVEDDDARIQWLFVSEVIEALLIQYARARGDDPETISRVQDATLQPDPGGVHDDHVHVRTACSPEEIVNGCVQTGPERAWFSAPKSAPSERDEDLVAAIILPLDKRTAAKE